MTTQAKVLFVCHTSTVSGAELVLCDLVKACQQPAAFIFEDGDLPRRLAGQGVDVEVFGGRNGGTLNSVRRGGSLAATIPLAGLLARLTATLIRRARSYDVLYANSQKALTLSALASAVTGTPLIWHLHDILSAEHFGSAQRRLQIALANRYARAVIVPSKATSDAFISEGGRPELVRIVPNGLDIDDDRIPRNDLRQQFGFPEDKVVGVFSRIAPWKGQHVMIEALAQLPGVTLIIVGSPLFGETQYESKLRTLAGKLGVSERVRFMGQRSDVGRLMRAVDVVVHPSVDPEPFGRTLVEAMLARTPVVATDAGAASEILSAGELGALVPPGESGALARAVSDAMAAFAQEGMRSRLDRAEQRARQDFSVGKMQESVADVIDEVIARRG
jgi:glycosyltransferase involved in cell wall biosynthesis